MFQTAHKLLRFQLARRFFSKDFEVQQGTLHLRFLEHLKKSQPITNSALTSLEELLKSEPKKFHSKEYFQLCDEIDKTCLHNLHDKKREEITAQLNAVVEAIPAHVADLKSFNESLTILIQKFDKNPKTKEFVKISFYLGLLKRKWPGPEMLSKLEKRHLEAALPNMTTIDFAIFCTACYKASVRTDSLHFKNRLIQEITGMEEIDQRLFVVFIKSLRMNEINTAEVLEMLRKQAKAGAFDSVDLEMLIHVFALIADNGIVDPELSGYFTNLCVSSIKEDSRVKDIQKFLFSCALLNVSFKPDQLTKIESHLKMKLRQKEYEKWFDSFVDAILSLWMLGLKSKELTDALITDRRFFKTGDRSRIKLDSRKKLLFSCIEIEKPEWLHPKLIGEPSFRADRPAPKYLITPELRDTLKNLRKDAAFVQQIQNLNIAGLLVKERGQKVVHFELLTAMNTMSDKKTPNGILALKLRLLKHMGCQVRLVSVGGSSFNDYNNGT